jgi:lipoprotein-anchoring transpeptidase ErfK/SrfK
LRPSPWLIVTGLAGAALSGCGPAAPDTAYSTQTPARRDRIALTSYERRTLPADMRTAAVRSLLAVERPMHYGGFLWNDADVPAGAIWIRVDLKRQLLSVFRGGDEIGTAVILYGADGLPTPRGRFPILARLKDHRSSSYDAPMPYTLRLTGDGVSIHGSNVRRGAATHGCIGIPTEFASRLFAAVRVGDPVTIA